MSITSLLMNVVIIALLLVTIGYCWVLNRRIRILQDSKSELAQLLRHFDESTERASESIIALQTASKKIGENIQHRIDKANFLLDDLSFMIDKGNKLATQMEAGFAVDRARNRVISQQHHEPELRAEPLASRLEPLAEPPQRQAAARPAHSTRERTAASLEALLERVVGRSRTPTLMEDDIPAGRPASPRRSKSEQELLDMIKAGIKG